MKKQPVRNQLVTHLHITMKQTARLTLLTLLLSGCCFIGQAGEQASPLERLILRETAEVPARGAVVIAHGLNQRPSSMDPLAEIFRSHGYHTLRISLAGHEAPSTETFSSETWVKQITSSLQETQRRYPHLPVYYLGYSMSGLAAVRALDSDPSFSPKKMILLAPALSLHTLVESASVLRWFPPTTFSVRNLAPQAYRRYPRTPLFWYRNVAEMYQQAAVLQHSTRAATTPTLVFANPRDELVSLKGLQSWISDNKLSDAWTLSVIRPRTPDPRLAEHLLIDQRALGEESWRSMTTQIFDFISKP